MFVKTKRKPLSYKVVILLKTGGWIEAIILTSFKSANDFSISLSNDGKNCAMIVTRGGKFEYEKMYYDQSGCAINQIRKGK